MTDGQGAFSEETITIAVGEVNAPPTLTNPGNKSLDEKSVLNFTLSGTDVDRSWERPIRSLTQLCRAV